MPRVRVPSLTLTEEAGDLSNQVTGLFRIRRGHAGAVRWREGGSREEAPQSKIFASEPETVRFKALQTPMDST
ncbi:hypothetical protein STAFG_8417 [Streptomyces afghaniensis 772]|uniref:Uncharacterized protein n=1 Tax=Streptomyces afghaniensis 772 TaxID=1283301 RepID=S4N9Q0_9ACTN|nr:hypothetical protein STAFG_8417 [Streptomyces afghaniensis 772]